MSRESSVSKIREKFKVNLSVQIKIENKKRHLLNSSMQKLMRKEKLDEQRKLQIMRKKEKDLIKNDEIRRRISDLMMDQKKKSSMWTSKISRIGSRLSNFTPNAKKSGFLSNSYSRNLHENFSEEKLQKINNKLEKSSDLYQARIRDKTERVIDHNEKVKETLKSQISQNEIITQSKLMNVIAKSTGLEKYKNKKKKIFEDLKLRKMVKLGQKHSKFQFNLEEEFTKMKKWVNKLENKSQAEKKVLMTQLAEMTKEQEFKALKKLLRDEDTRENLARIKKESNKKRVELLEKYLEEQRRFIFMKESKEKMNQKIRFEASLAKQEHMKAKIIHIMINRSDDPNDISKVINEKF